MDESKLVPIGKPLLVNAQRMSKKQRADSEKEHDKDQVIRYAMGAEGIMLLILVEKGKYIKEESGLGDSERSKHVLHELLGQLHDRLWPDHNDLVPDPKSLRGSLDVLTEQLKDPEIRNFVKLAVARAEMGTVDPRSSQSHQN